MTHASPITHANAQPCKDLLRLADLPAEDLRELLSAARDHADVLAGHPAGVPASLTGQIIGLLFFEDSTRTRLSFAVAVQRLGGRFVELTELGSSLSKGETLADTARTIEAMGVSRLVVRSRRECDLLEIASAVRIPVLNAGAGDAEHPTQGLLDALTLCDAASDARRDRWRALDLGGLTVMIVGDVARSRVARSSGPCMAALGARVLVAGPGIDERLARTVGGEPEHDFEQRLSGVDAVMALRIQHERGRTELDEEGADEAYRLRFGLTLPRLARMKPGAVVMHPGPANLGVEIDEDAALSQRSVISRQVAMGVPVRMACLERFGSVTRSA
ncbi:MAG: aspartate carbamoyltransferase catalytic subunit [Planctomycetota bacterium]